MRGAGLGGLFGSIARKLLPFAQKYILPNVMEAAKNVVSELGQGRNIRESLKENATAALKNAGKQYFNQSGSGMRRRRKVRRKTKATKRKTIRKKRATKKAIKRRTKKKSLPLNTIFH